jgi:hypothetical protein
MWPIMVAYVLLSVVPSPMVCARVKTPLYHALQTMFIEIYGEWARPRLFHLPFFLLCAKEKLCCHHAKRAKWDFNFDLASAGGANYT